MKKLSILFFFLAPASLLKAGGIDTTDLCHVFLHGKNILSINQNDFETAELKLKKPNLSDTLKIYYFTDHPTGRRLKFEIRDKKNRPLLSKTPINDNKTPFLLYGSDLLFMKSCTIYLLSDDEKNSRRILTISLKK
jgi:hypothetical protein